MSGLRRRRLHHRAALALERAYADHLEDYAPRLGRHFSEAGDGEKASEYLLKAGDRAFALYAYQDATEHYQQALAVLKAQGAQERAVQVLMKLGVVYHMLYDFERSREAYKEAFEIRRRSGEPRTKTALPDAPHALRGHWNDPITLDPTLADDMGSIGILKQLFSGLLEISPEDEVVPEMAHSWDVLEGGRKYVFHMREDVIWSDGVPVSAGDFEYAWKRTLNPALASRAAEWLYDIRGAEAYNRGELTSADEVGIHAPDDHTLVVELEDPCGHFFHILAISATYPVPRHVVEQYGAAWTEAANLVVNGPFQLEVWEPKKRLILVRNDLYRGQFSGNLRGVEFHLRLKWAEILERYEADELDIINEMPTEGMDRARLKHTADYLTGDYPGTGYVCFDASRPPFDDLRVRRAFVQAVDRERLAGDVLRGYVYPAKGGFVPPGIPGHSADIGLPYDPERAQQQLAEAGFPQGQGFPPVQVLMSRGLEETSKAGEFIIQEWRENLNVELNTEFLDYPEFRERLEADLPHVFLMGWNADYPDPDNMLNVALSSPRTRQVDETFLKLIQEARHTTEQAKRISLYQQADQRLMENATIMPTMYGRWHVFLKPWMSGLHISVAMKTLELKHMVIQPH